AKPEKAVVRPKELIEALATEPANRSDQQRKLLAGEPALAKIDMAVKTLPAQSHVYAVASDFPADGNFKPPQGPRKVEVLRRGDIRYPLRDSAPGALKCVSSGSAK